MHPSELEASLDRQWDDLRLLMIAYAARQPVAKVAVVGNAPLQPDVERANDIDTADLVIRANSLALDEPDDSPTLGTACHVVLLSRATRITPWVFRDYRRRLYLVMQTGFTTFHTLRDHVGHWPADLGAMPLPNGAVTSRLVDRLEPVHEPGTVLPTTGTTAVFLAAEMFPDADVVVTGLSFLDGVQQGEWQHHAGGSTGVNPKHHLNREGAFVRDLIDADRVRFRR